MLKYLYEEKRRELDPLAPGLPPNPLGAGAGPGGAGGGGGAAATARPPIIQVHVNAATGHASVPTMKSMYSLAPSTKPEGLEGLREKEFSLDGNNRTESFTAFVNKYHTEVRRFYANETNEFYFDYDTFLTQDASENSKAIAEIARLRTTNPKATWIAGDPNRTDEQYDIMILTSYKAGTVSDDIHAQATAVSGANSPVWGYEPMI